MNIDYFNKSKPLISQALKALGKKNLALIMHGSSFPSNRGENTGIGSPNSRAARELINFVSGIFNAVQLGPYGKTKKSAPSPYTATIFSNNPLFIDLEQLTGKEFGGILEYAAYEQIFTENPVKESSKLSYKYIYECQNSALKSAYFNFMSSDLTNLKKEFETYKSDNNSWLEKDSLYEVLTIEHGNDYWPNWKSDLDKNLYNAKTAIEQKSTQDRINEIKEKYGEEIDFYAFCQFIAFKQNETSKNYALKQGIKMIADRQVAFSDRDVWANQSFMLEGWFLGCPPDYFSEDGQAWGFPLLAPDKFFNKNGTLASAGILMKELYKKIFAENPGGVRIDHIIGLIDPWVYKEGKKPTIKDGAGRLYSSPEHKELSKYSIVTEKDLNIKISAAMEQRVAKVTPAQIKKYAAFIEKIVLAAAQEVGLDNDAIVCEDLGTLTTPVKEVMKKYDLQGMRNTPFTDPTQPQDAYRCCNIPKRAWMMAGTHDNEPLSLWAEKLIFTHPSYLHALNLAQDMWFDLSPEKREQRVVRLTKDAKYLVQTKITELFASEAENVQIFFSDFFGLQEVYNVPGTTNDVNWTLRLEENYQETYFERCKNGYAIDLLLILKLALESRGNDFAKKNVKLIEKMSELMDGVY